MLNPHHCYSPAPSCGDPTVLTPLLRRYPPPQFELHHADSLVLNLLVLPPFCRCNLIVPGQSEHSDRRAAWAIIE